MEDDGSENHGYSSQAAPVKVMPVSGELTMSPSPSFRTATTVVDFVARLKAKREKRRHARRSSALAIAEVHIKEKPLHTSNLQIFSVQKLGEGTSGQAFRVHRALDDRDYCLKVVPLQDDDDTARTAVIAEAKIHSKVNHEGVVKYCYSWLDSCDGATHFCMLMEMCKSDLWSCLEDGQPNSDEKRRWSLQLAGALEHIRSHTIIHRDLNPWNVLVTDARDVKIGDFGLSVLCDPSAILKGWESPGAVPLDCSAIGSLYSAPELGDEYNHQADVFSLGMTLFVIWHTKDISVEGAEDDLIACVEALHESGAVPEGFELECPISALIQKMVSHTAHERPTATAVYNEMRQLWC